MLSGEFMEEGPNSRSKTGGTKRNRLTGTTKLSDMNKEGTHTASQCTLILTEGDSAKTPIIRVTKGKRRIDFFTIFKYEQLPEQTPDAHKWNSKYYKNSDAHDYSHDRTWFHLARRNGERELIDLTFSKKKADDHKEWLW
ncbi:DNA topoisomerase [Lactarius deliciosus]|nr:DNA topoisomerase [Lactarius deliciosus]